MMRSIFLFWRQKPILVILLASLSLLSIGSFVIMLNRSSSGSSEIYDLDLLSSFCNQKQSNNDRQLPQWVMGHQHPNDKALIESEQVNHIYGKYDEFKSSAGGQKSIDNEIWEGLPVKGAFYMLVQEVDLAGAKETIRNLQDMFTSNRNTSYPFVILSTQLIKPEFKKYVRKATSSPERIFFGQIDLEAWSYPYWIDSTRSENAMQRLRRFGLGGAISSHYNKAQRYNAGLFFHHPLFDDVEYVWRLEPGSSYSCNMFQNDPFEILHREGKKLGFVITDKENPYNVRSLYLAAEYYTKNNKAWILPEKDTIAPWLLDEDNKYNQCQISSFQIVDMTFLKSEHYQRWFHYLDLVGGFFYERWSDASVRTIAASMFLKKTEITYLNTIGFESQAGEHCPYGDENLRTCTCDFKNNHAFFTESCTLELLEYLDPLKLKDVLQYFEEKVPSSGDEELDDPEEEL